MSDGSVTYYARLDIAQVESAASQLRATLGGVEQGVAKDSTAAAAALSRQALATGDVTSALRQMDALLGKTNTETAAAGKTATDEAVAQSRLAAALGDRARAIELLEGLITTENAETKQGIALATQITILENQETAALQRAADQRVRIAATEARALAIKKDYAGALGVVRTAQETETQAGAGALSQLTAQAAQYEVAGTATGAFGAHLGALLNPLTLTIAGLGLATKAVTSFGDALHNQGQIEEERRAFGGIIGSFSQGNQVIDSAIARTRAYGFTAKETTDAFRELAPVIRESTSSVGDQADALIRISTLKPDDPVKALTSAIEGIKTGRFRELSKELGLSADEQKRLKDDVDGGKDSFIALNDVLDRHGITLKVAKERMDGYAGAEYRAQIAAEDFEKAQADFAQGPGVAFVQAKTIAYRSLIDLLNSPGARNPLGFGSAIGTELVRFAAGEDRASAATDTHTSALLRSADADDRVAAALGPVIDMEDRRVQQINRTHQAQADATRDLLNGINTSAAASAVDTAAKDAQQAKTSLLTAQSNAAAAAFLALNPQIDASGIIALEAAGKLDPEIAKIAALQLAAQGATADLIAFNNAQAQGKVDKLIGLRSKEGIGSGRGGGSDAQTDSAAFVGVLQKQNTEAAKLLDSEIGLAGAKKETAKQIELLRQKQSQYAKGTAEYNSIEAQIIGIQTAGGKTRVSAAQSTALQLQNTEENNQLALARIQREGLERLRDQEQDYALKRTRSKEDEDEKIRSLLAHGQRAQAAKERADFEKQQRRDQEDHAIQTQRTLRNNAEQSEDQNNKTDLRQGQIGARAALRGVRTNGDVAQGATSAAPASLVGGGRVISITLPAAVYSPDGTALGNLVYPTIAQRLDDDLSIEIRGANPPGSNQGAVAGSRP